MFSADPLLPGLALLRPRIPRLLLAILCGVLSLGSALALAGVSAWLITRAWQMPPVLDLSIPVVAVRAFGISRGVLHYCERLLSHDTALRAAGSARQELYTRLAHGPVENTARLHAGELVGRVGSDVDQLADALVRAVLPIAVAAVLSVAAVVTIALISPAAAAVLAACLLVAGVVAPWLSARGAAAQEQLARTRHSERDIAAMLALEHAPELRIAGRLPAVIAETEQRQRDWGSALDRAALPAALGAAVPTLAVGISVLGAAVAGIGIAASVAPTTLAILMLLPLSAFEATTALPTAAVQLTRSRIAARRLLDLSAPDVDGVLSHCTIGGAPRSLCAAVTVGFPDAGRSAHVVVDLEPGARLVITGASGSGKTTALMTLAGLIPPLTGAVTIGGHPLSKLTEGEIRSTVIYFAEDAHIFATTVRDNLLVVRGDCTDDELMVVVHRVGLSPWLAGLPDGLGTVLTGGASALSAGQRRRLLMARILLSSAPIVLLDEPTEHLDAEDADVMLRQLLAAGGGLLSADRTVVVATHHPAPDLLGEISWLNLRAGTLAAGRPQLPDLECE